MNKKIVQELLKQLQQENQDPKDIGKLKITNIIIWMKKEAYEPTTIQRVARAVPIASGTYGNGQYTLSTLAPHESLQITIKIIPSLAYRTPRLYGNEVSVVWTNSP